MSDDVKTTSEPSNGPSTEPQKLEPQKSPNAQPPSDHHIDEDGNVIRSERQKQLLADLAAMPKVDRTPTGDEDGRLRARKLREPATYIADQSRLHERMKLDDPYPEPLPPEAPSEEKIEAREEPAPEVHAEHVEAEIADTEPPPTPKGEAHDEHEPGG